MRRISHGLGNVTLLHGRRIHRLPALGERNLRPVYAVGQHELLANNLAHLEEVLAEAQDRLHRGRNADRVGRESVGLIGRSVMNDPEVGVNLRKVRDWDRRGAKSEASPGVYRKLLAHAVTGSLEVNLEHLFPIVSQHPVYPKFS